MRTSPGKLIGENGPKSQLQDSFTRITAPEGDVTAMPNTMPVFAHPDDEVIALGGRLGRFHTAYFVHVTDGAPRDEQDRRARTVFYRFRTTAVLIEPHVAPAPDCDQFVTTVPNCKV
jgi:hypothetical protein